MNTRIAGVVSIRGPVLGGLDLKNIEHEIDKFRRDLESRFLSRLSQKLGKNGFEPVAGKKLFSITLDLKCLSMDFGGGLSVAAEVFLGSGSGILLPNDSLGRFEDLGLEDPRDIENILTGYIQKGLSGIGKAQNYSLGYRSTNRGFVFQVVNQRSIRFLLRLG